MFNIWPNFSQTVKDIYFIIIQLALKFASAGSIANKSALTWSSDAYMRQ